MQVTYIGLSEYFERCIPQAKREGYLFIISLIARYSDAQDLYEKLEKDKTKLIAFYDVFSLTDKIDILFDIGIKLYIDILNYKLKRKIEYFENNIDIIKNISNFNEFNDIIRKIEIINDFQKKSSYNVNKELFINNFIITFSGGNL